MKCATALRICGKSACPSLPVSSMTTMVVVGRTNREDLAQRVPPFLDDEVVRRDVHQRTISGVGHDRQRDALAAGLRVGACAAARTKPPRAPERVEDVTCINCKYSYEL